MDGVLQVFMDMRSKVGFLVEINCPSAPGIQQAHKIGSFALGPPDAAPSSSQEAAWRDIILYNEDGHPQSLIQLMPQIFLPAQGQQLCRNQRPFRMHVNSREVPQNSHLWSLVLEQGGRPSARLPIKVAKDGETLGHMQIMKLPPRFPAEPAARAAASGIIFVMPNSDAVYNLQPEVSSCQGIYAC